jgi:hypothetical protein
MSPSLSGPVNSQPAIEHERDPRSRMARAYLIAEHKKRDLLRPQQGGLVGAARTGVGRTGGVRTRPGAGPGADTGQTRPVGWRGQAPIDLRAPTGGLGLGAERVEVERRRVAEEEGFVPGAARAAEPLKPARSRHGERSEVRLRGWRRYGGTAFARRGWVAQPKLAEGERRLAEGEGFEPPVRFPVQRFSRPPPSTARPSLRYLGTTDQSLGLGGHLG